MSNNPQLSSIDASLKSINTSIVLLGVINGIEAIILAMIWLAVIR